MTKCKNCTKGLYIINDTIDTMIKETNTRKNKAGVLYTIDTEYNMGIRVMTNNKFKELCNNE